MLRARKGVVARLCASVVIAVSIVGGLAAVATAALPDGRAYELVSPADKGGADVMGESTRTRVAEDGDAVGFASLGGFAGTLGTGVAAEYMSRRTGIAGTSGWTTHPLLPQVDPNSYNSASQAMDTFYQSEFSEDFSSGVLRTFTNLAGDPNIANITSLYLRDDLSTPGLGSYELITACAICVAPLRFSTAGANPLFVGATPDLGHIIFEARYNYTADAPAQPAGCLNTGTACRPRLYDWDHGTLRFVGVLPADEGGTGVNFSIAGFGPSGGRYTLNTISEDGARIIWTAIPNNGTPNGPLYMRENHTDTIRLSASERTDCAGDPDCGGDDVADPSPDPNGEQPARYETASKDASKTFFTTSEQLTDDDDNGNFDLYVYDAALPASDPHNLTRISLDGESDDPTGDAIAVMGASDDASYVYFVSTSQLVDDEPLLNGSPGVFMWHSGALAYIGALSMSDPDINGRGNSFGTSQLGSRVAPDGRHLLFTSHSGEGLTGYDHNTAGCGNSGNESCIELYLYGADDESLACATCNPNVAKATTDSTFGLGTGAGGSAPTSHLSHPLSVDGSRVFFTTGERLVPEDRNGTRRDVYVYDADTGQQHLLSSGKGESDSYFMDASPEGDDAFFVTRERLVGWDVDNSYDLYDARVGGGLPEPIAPTLECSGDTCQGTVSAPPVAPAPKSTEFFGGNDNVKHVAPKPKKCKKGKVRKRVDGKVKCVKKKAKGKQTRTHGRAR